MSTQLTTHRKGPAQATSLVVLLHGYGADGRDLLSLAEYLAPHMPGTVFVAPDAPERCVLNPAGFQWFPVSWIDGSSSEDMEAGIERSAEDLDAYLDHIIEHEGVSSDRVILLGFSQGTMMSLRVAPRRAQEIAGIVGFSGRLLDAETLQETTKARPPVLLLHGDQDDVVSPQSMPIAVDALGEAGFSVHAYIMKGAAHTIAPDGLDVARAFMIEKLGI